VEIRLGLAAGKKQVTLLDIMLVCHEWVRKLMHVLHLQIGTAHRGRWRLCIALLSSLVGGKALCLRGVH
jgi:hypothetical protein